MISSKQFFMDFFNVMSQCKSSTLSPNFFLCAFATSDNLFLLISNRIDIPPASSTVSECIDQAGPLLQ